jgi:predicted nucleic acid-binding protein
MGLIRDSSVLITAEPEGQNARQLLAAISGKAGNTDIAISVVTLIDLAHGAARADTSQGKERQQQFIQELLTALPIHSVIALRASRYRRTSVSVTPWFSRRQRAGTQCRVLRRASP